MTPVCGSVLPSFRPSVTIFVLPTLCHVGGPIIHLLVFAGIHFRVFFTAKLNPRENESL